MHVVNSSCPDFCLFVVLRMTLYIIILLLICENRHPYICKLVGVLQQIQQKNIIDVILKDMSTLKNSEIIVLIVRGLSQIIFPTVSIIMTLSLDPTP